MSEAARLRRVEVRSYKWPRRRKGATSAVLLGEDSWGRWVGVRQGDPWRDDDGRAGVFVHPLVKVVPSGTWWTACFTPADPVVDVDIVLPVTWGDGGLDEVDLEVDVLRLADGRVIVRDWDKLERVRAEHGLPDDVAARVRAESAEVERMVARREEPFGEVGPAWLARLLALPAD